MLIKSYFDQLKKVNRGGYLDVIWCTLRYGASPNNYKDFQFDQLTAKERSSYVTNRLSQKMIRKFNDPEYIEVFENKIEFAKRFDQYFKRDWISSEHLTLDELSKFVKNKNRIIYKPVNEAQGQGILVFDNFTDCKKIFNEIKLKNEVAILEDWIEQHHVLSAIYPDAINCLRIITVLNENRVEYLTGGVTWGNGKNVANASASGIVSPVDFSTGVLYKPAADFYGNVYEKHPITGENLLNIEVPFWKETIEMLERATREVPQIGYVGWDIAVTPTGPVIIEGNTTPGYKYYQIPVHMMNKKGNREVYLQCIK